MEAGIKVREEKEEQYNKPVMLFGRDIRKIPCFRDSFFYGICGGIAGSLISFMFTSKVRMSSHIGFTCLWVCVFGYWFPCRWNYETTQINVERWKDMMKNKRKVDEE